MTAISKTRVILEAVFDEAPLAEACQACQAGLAAFVDAEVDGQPATSLFPVVAGHLATCAACRQEHADLRSLLGLERQGQLEQPPAPIEFDFSYLAIGPFSGERSNRSAGWRLDALGRLVIQFSADLLRALQPPALQLGYLKGDAQPSLSYALANQIDDLNVHIHVDPARRDPQRAIIEVDVEIPSRGGWPNLAGSVVTLRRGDDLLDEQETDPFGKVVFGDVPAEDLPALVFEIATS